MTKEDMKRNTDQHIASTWNNKDKRKGYRATAWSECKALEQILKANKEAR